MAETFIGKPCGKGHDGLRYASTGMCVGCSKAHYQRNREAKAAEYLAIKEAIKPRKAAAAKVYYQQNKDRIKAQQKEYYQANKERWRIKVHKRRSASGGGFTAQDVKALKAKQKGKCAVCLKPYGRFHVDHIMPLSKGGLNAASNLQLLCAPCNLGKHAKHPVDFMQSRGFLL